jgi:hypothetical protein
MSPIETEEISLDKIYELAFNVFSNYGCDTDNATAIARTITNAKRDGLFPQFFEKKQKLCQGKQYLLH